jgi:hypothetical protein
MERMLTPTIPHDLALVNQSDADPTFSSQRVPKPYGDTVKTVHRVGSGRGKKDRFDMISLGSKHRAAPVLERPGAVLKGGSPGLARLE